MQILQRTARVTITGVAPFSPSKAFDPDTAARREQETADDHEKRVWRERIHRDRDGTCVIPAMMLQLMIQEGAKRLGKIPGMGNKTYLGIFMQGVAIPDDARIEGTDWEAVRGLWLHLNADGKRGGGKRVWKCMPMVDEWTASFDIILLDGLVTEDLLAKCLSFCGLYVGVGRFAPRRGGTNGRFKVDSIEILEATA